MEWIVLSKASISVVIPVYQSEETLNLLYRRLIKVLNSQTNKLEIIFVDDGSYDNSWHSICELAQSDSRVYGIQHGRNYGQHNALLTGIRAAKNEIIVTLDDDLQNPPEELPKMLEALKNEYDVVYGTPRKGQHSFFRNCASHCTKMILQRFMGAEIAINVSTFRVFRSFLREVFLNYDGSYVSVDVLLTWGTTRFTSVTVDHKERLCGTSNYTIGKLVTHAVNMITGFSILPLRLTSIVGLIFTLFGFGVLLYVLTGYFLHGSTVSGFAFLASMGAIFSGTQMFALGVMGEYLARIHLNNMNKPSGIIRQRVGE